MKRIWKAAPLLVAVGWTLGACSDQGPVAPLDEAMTLSQEAEIALALVGDDLATEAALAMAEVGADAAMRMGRGPAVHDQAQNLANQARLRFEAAIQAMGLGDQTRATVRAREARRLVAQAMEQVGGTGALAAAVGRIEDLEESVAADVDAYEDANRLLGELAMLRNVARNQLRKGDLLGAAATAVLAEQHHRHRHRWRHMNREVRIERAELMVGLAESAVGLATRLLDAAGGPDEDQAAFLAAAEEELAQAQAALEAGDTWRAIHLAHLAEWSALKAVILPGEVTDGEARAMHELAADLLGQAELALGEDATELQSLLLDRATRLIAHGESKLADGEARGIAAFWQAAVICNWLLG